MTQCEWFESNLEKYFCDSLSEPDMERCERHLASCTECRHNVESLKSVDSLVQDVFHQRLERAWNPPGRRGSSVPFQIALAGAGLVVAAILVWGLLSLRAPSSEPSFATEPQGAPQLQQAGTNEPKAETPSQPNRAKPDEGQPAALSPQPDLDTPSAGGPDFSITDEAGYTSTLETYRGRFLLFGVVSPAVPKAISNLDSLYKDYGANPGIRILGVASRRTEELGAFTFPKFFNHGSRLMGVQEGRFMLIDPDGIKLLEGSLQDTETVGKIRNRLDESGIR